MEPQAAQTEKGSPTNTPWGLAKAWSPGKLGARDEEELTIASPSPLRWHRRAPATWRTTTSRLETVAESSVRSMQSPGTSRNPKTSTKASPGSHLRQCRPGHPSEQGAGPSSTSRRGGSKTGTSVRGRRHACMQISGCARSPCGRNSSPDLPKVSARFGGLQLGRLECETMAFVVKSSRKFTLYWGRGQAPLRLWRAWCAKAMIRKSLARSIPPNMTTVHSQQKRVIGACEEKS